MYGGAPPPFSSILVVMGQKRIRSLRPGCSIRSQVSVFENCSSWCLQGGNTRGSISGSQKGARGIINGRGLREEDEEARISLIYNRML